MYHVSAQGVDERMINVHNYYYYFSSNAQVNNSHYVFFGDPTVYDWDDDDGTKAAHNWDRDGSLTGTPNTYIVRNRPFFTGPECLHRPDWHMSVCPYRYIKVGEWSCICLGCCHCCGGGVRRWGFPFVRSFVRSFVLLLVLLLVLVLLVLLVLVLVLLVLLLLLLLLSRINIQGS